MQNGSKMTLTMRPVQTRLQPVTLKHLFPPTRTQVSNVLRFHAADQRYVRLPLLAYRLLIESTTLRGFH